MTGATPSTTGLLLVNLGTPDAPTTPAVRRYLREFLSDPKVIDVNRLARFLLVNGIIAPFRSPRSAAAYRLIWTDEGSPLLVHGRRLTDAVRERLIGTPVELAMRYGRPTIDDALGRLAAAGVRRVVCFPLYPQNADSSVGSTVAALEAAARRSKADLTVEFVPPFFDATPFIESAAAVGRPVLAALDPDHVLFSFHGLPERHVRKADRTGEHCLAAEICCAAITDANRGCYRAQSFETARRLAAALDLAGDAWSVAFQSRLGRTPWIRPFTDEVVPALARRGVRRLAVFCPAFVADCLETLEEIGLRAAASFRSAGGDRLELVPCVNADPRWADGVVELVRPFLDGATGRTEGAAGSS